MKHVSAAEFTAKCPGPTDEVQAGGEPITRTKHGRAAVTLTAARTVLKGAPIGCRRGDVLRYDAPFEPALDEAELPGADGQEALYGSSRR